MHCDSESQWFPVAVNCGSTVNLILSQIKCRTMTVKNYLKVQQMVASNVL